MARAKKTAALHDRKLTKVPINGPTLKTVVLVWALCVLPSMSGACWVVYQKYPKPFDQAWAGAKWGVTTTVGAVQGWQRRRAATAAAEEKKRKAAEAAAAEAAAAAF